MPTGQEAPPATAICDFCTLAPAPWSYPCRTFRLVLQSTKTEFHSIGDWGACDACRELIDAEKPSELLARVMLGNVVKGLPPVGPVYQARCEDMLRTMQLFFKNRLGPAEPYV